ncbi:Retrovirus-related Pol polyprotein from transposon TNT 1-94 [Vitis vinifera]|uniref:Retrovirus-related Pol polyprotein from transposon TNT 1-94 n=1 Tax=Vitis vinifera TaxID=29760 RepID=A0A438DK69_VITVI|nr:Retrovirus-related Pol polyprotein from transposon TNT 1-94 [Vitis vinifera]
MENGQTPRPFAKFLQEHGIVAQYTMPGYPDQNGVAEKRNQTLLDMVRSMLSSSKLPRFLWTEALKTTVYILNQVPTKLSQRRHLSYGKVENRVCDICAFGDAYLKLFVVHNTPQVQTGVERTIVEVQLVIEVPQVVDNISIDHVDQELPDTSEQQVEPHTSQEDNVATLRWSTQTKRELEEEVYMKQPGGFPSSDGEQLVFKLKKSIYGFKTSIPPMVNGSKVCFLVLYVDDILLATNDKGLLHEVKQFISKNFDMKDMSQASYVIGIKIHRDKFQGILGLSQETYINKVLERFWMKDCSPSVSPIVKVDRFNLNQCPKNNLEREQMKNIPYASTVESLMSLSIYYNNSVVVFMAKNNKSGSRSKHIDIKYLAIRKHVKEKKVVIEHISTEFMIVDPLTKGMPPLKFKDHVVNMRLSSLM